MQGAEALLEKAALQCSLDLQVRPTVKWGLVEKSRASCFLILQYKRRRTHATSSQSGHAARRRVAEQGRTYEKRGK